MIWSVHGAASLHLWGKVVEHLRIYFRSSESPLEILGGLSVNYPKAHRTQHYFPMLF